MGIPEGQLYNDNQFPLGVVAGHYPGERINSRTADGEIPFGAGVVRSDPGLVKVPDGAPFVLEGIAMQSSEAALLDTSKYSDNDVVGVLEEGIATVFTEEAVNENDPVRIRHSEDVRAGSQAYGFESAKTAASASGLANDATAYTAVIAVDGVNKNISIVGSAAQTLQTVIDEINTDLGVDAVAEFDTTGNGFIKITSATKGASSSIAITDTDLFSSLSNSNEEPEAAVPGSDSVDTTKFPGTFRTTAVAGETALLTNVRWGGRTLGPGPVPLILYGNISASADTE